MSDKQNRKLIAALRNGPMTAMQMLQQLGIMRASARVFDLRAAGYNIESRQVTVRNRDGGTSHVAEYRLASQQRTLLPAHPGRGAMTAKAVGA